MSNGKIGPEVAWLVEQFEQLERPGDHVRMLADARVRYGPCVEAARALKEGRTEARSWPVARAPGERHSRGPPMPPVRSPAAAAARGEVPALAARPRERTLVLVLGALAAIGPLAIDMYLPAFPAISLGLAAPPSLVSLTLTAYFAGIAVGQLVIGQVSDRIGRVKPVRGGLALFVLGSLTAALAPSIEVLIAARVFQAVGGAACAVASRAVVRDLYGGAAAARINSRLVLVMGVAPILAPMLGGALLEFGGWRVIFLALAGAGLAALAVAWTWLPETAPPSVGDRPLALRALVRDREFVSYALVLALSQATLFAYITGVPFVLIELHGVSPAGFALLFGGNAAAYVAASQLNAYLLRAREPARLLVAGVATALASTAALLVIAITGAGGVGQVALCLFILLGSFGLILPNGTALALEGQAERAGVAAAWLGTIGFSLAALASAATGALHDGTARPLAGMLLGLTLLAALVLLLGRRAARRASA
jgi:DHA1 family bicyclomycin/chloramphenicol resistance-like MFS transporter